MLNKHTPGPWIMQGVMNGITVRIMPETLREDPSATQGGPGCIAELKLPHVGMAEIQHPSEQGANACLIAAAPDLLDALKEAVKCVEYCRHNHPDAQNGSGYPIEMIWKTIIAKAEGR